MGNFITSTFSYSSTLREAIRQEFDETTLSTPEQLQACVDTLLTHPKRFPAIFKLKVLWCSLDQFTSGLEEPRGCSKAQYHGSFDMTWLPSSLLREWDERFVLRQLFPELILLSDQWKSSMNARRLESLWVIALYALEWMRIFVYQQAYLFLNATSLHQCQEFLMRLHTSLTQMVTHSHWNQSDRTPLSMNEIEAWCNKLTYWSIQVLVVRRNLERAFFLLSHFCQTPIPLIRLSSTLSFPDEVIGFSKIVMDELYARV